MEEFWNAARGLSGLVIDASLSARPDQPPSNFLLGIHTRHQELLLILSDMLHLWQASFDLQFFQQHLRSCGIKSMTWSRYFAMLHKALVQRLFTVSKDADDAPCIKLKVQYKLSDSLSVEGVFELEQKFDKDFQDSMGKLVFGLMNQLKTAQAHNKTVGSVNAIKEQSENEIHVPSRKLEKNVIDDSAESRLKAAEEELEDLRDQLHSKQTLLEELSSQAPGTVNASSESTKGSSANSSSKPQISAALRRRKAGGIATADSLLNPAHRKKRKVAKGAVFAGTLVEEDESNV